MAEGTHAPWAWGQDSTSIWLILPLVTEPLLPDGQLFLAQSLSQSFAPPAHPLQEVPERCLLDLNPSWDCDAHSGKGVGAVWRGMSFLGQQQCEYEFGPCASRSPGFGTLSLKYSKSIL